MINLIRVKFGNFRDDIGGTDWDQQLNTRRTGIYPSPEKGPSVKTNHHLRGLLEKTMSLNQEPSSRGTFKEKENDNPGWISGT